MKSKKQRCLEAETRQESYNNLTLGEKLKKLNDGKFVAKRERRKLGFPPYTGEM